MLYREIIAVCFDIRKLFEQNAAFLIVKCDGTYIIHRAWKGQKSDIF
jgi:hypothetical protein